MGEQATNPGAASVWLSLYGCRSHPCLSVSGSEDCCPPQSVMLNGSSCKRESRSETESEEWNNLHVRCASRKQAYVESKVHDHCANRN